MRDLAIHTLELCAGYGGFTLALRLAGISARTVCYVEREAFAAAVLAKKMEQGWLDQAPVWSDLATFNGKPWRGKVDLITAGFPCQPWSKEGNRLGQNDKRYYGVWPHIARIAKECEAGMLFLENVSLDAFQGPRSDLEGLGYQVSPAVRVSASDVGAPHQRDRWWCFAANAQGQGLQGQREKPGRTAKENKNTSDLRWWAVEPNVGRVAYGSSVRVDRLRMLGNGIVPLAGAVAFRFFTKGQER
jgi:DNA (cytosine-5)-methyltransferase 1